MCMCKHAAHTHVHLEHMVTVIDCANSAVPFITVSIALARPAKFIIAGIINVIANIISRHAFILLLLLG
jgi:hypothetical protein